MKFINIFYETTYQKVVIFFSFFKKMQEELIDPNRSLALPKIRAMKTIRQMFLDRGYNKNMQVKFDQHWQILTTTAQNEKVMAVFADCKMFGDVMQIEAFPSENNSLNGNNDISHNDGGSRNNTGGINNNDTGGKNKNTGTDFIKSLLEMAENQKIKIIILISDFITPHALKYVTTLEHIQFLHFSYEEAGIEDMARHIMQPVVFRALNPSEKQEYIRKNPRYAIERPRYSINDPLVKYYGMKIGDIIYYEDNDRQTGLEKDYGLIVEDL